VPGPGSYAPKINIGDPNVTTSVYKTPLMRSFYHHDRFPTSNRNHGGLGTSKSLFLINSAIDSPGPHHY
jgi:hypothetical protein